MFSQGEFPHRRNWDGSYASICTACLMTVASAEHEWQLAPFELAHVCDPMNLYRVSEECRLTTAKRQPLSSSQFQT